MGSVLILAALEWVHTHGVRMGSVLMFRSVGRVAEGLGAAGELTHVWLLSSVGS